MGSTVGTLVIFVLPALCYLNEPTGCVATLSFASARELTESAVAMRPGRVDTESMSTHDQASMTSTNFGSLVRSASLLGSKLGVFARLQAYLLLVSGVIISTGGFLVTLLNWNEA